jgi:phytoene synthase
VKAHEILAALHSDRFVALMRFQAQRAHALYDEALALLPPKTSARRSPA